MAEYGFYHPDLGYWQEIAEPAGGVEPNRPEGTVRVPLKPGEHYEYRDEKWQAVEPPAPAPPTLTPRQFEWLLAYSGLDDVWDAAQARAKNGGNRSVFALLKAQRSAAAYVLEEVLAFKNSPAIRSVANEAAPDADLSDEAIRQLWHEAAAQTFQQPIP